MLFVFRANSKYITGVSLAHNCQVLTKGIFMQHYNAFLL